MVERSRLGELLYPDASKDRTFRSSGVDGGDRVAGAIEGDGQISLPASHLQHPGGSGTDLIEDESLDAMLPPGGLTHATGRCHEMCQAERKLDQPSSVPAWRLPLLLRR
jgi:hypothetical protein